MPNVIHRTTLAYKTSANESDHPEPEWKWSPDMSAVAGVPRNYWKWDAVAERPVEMTQGEKDAADLAQDVAEKNAAMDTLDELNSITRGLGLVLFDVVNDVRTRHGDAEITLAQFKAQVRARMD
jgi:hypothetical protein